ncbi:MAG: hypothetical protein RLZZ241_2130 [Bacteroidota bacterium]|jgi:hypothetical protein
MPVLDTKHKRKSIALTTLLLSLILLLLFYVGLTYFDPPKEEGITVNLGTLEVGSGLGQLKETVKIETPDPLMESSPSETDPFDVPEEKSEVDQADPLTEPEAEKVLTQNQEESIRLQQLKTDRERAAQRAKQIAEAERQALAVRARQEEERLEREKQAAIEAQRREQEEKKRKLDALMGGVNAASGQTSGGAGNDTKPGDKGQPNGNPYAASYYGAPGSGSGNNGYGLGGRSLVGKGQERQQCNEAGRVVVRIVVDRSGKVIQATPGVKGTTNPNPCLLEPARATAVLHRWNADANAPEEQVGFVVVNFILGQ